MVEGRRVEVAPIDSDDDAGTKAHKFNFCFTCKTRQEKINNKAR